MKIGDKFYNRGKWSDEENRKLLSALEIHGNKWGLVEQIVGTRTRMQIRSHCQKYFKKVLKGAIEKAKKEENEKPQQHGYNKRRPFVITQEYRRCATNMDIYNFSKYIQNPKQLKEEEKEQINYSKIISVNKLDIATYERLELKYGNNYGKQPNTPLEDNKACFYGSEENHYRIEDDDMASDFHNNLKITFQYE